MVCGVRVLKRCVRTSSSSSYSRVPVTIPICTLQAYSVRLAIDKVKKASSSAPSIATRGISISSSGGFVTILSRCVALTIPIALPYSQFYLAQL